MLFLEYATSIIRNFIFVANVKPAANVIKSFIFNEKRIIFVLLGDWHPSCKCISGK